MCIWVWMGVGYGLNLCTCGCMWGVIFSIKGQSRYTVYHLTCKPLLYTILVYLLELLFYNAHICMVHFKNANFFTCIKHLKGQSKRLKKCLKNVLKKRLELEQFISSPLNVHLNCLLHILQVISDLDLKIKLSLITEAILSKKVAR